MVWGGNPTGDVDTQPAVIQKVQPPLTGSLKLGAQEGINRIVSQLFHPQNDLQFRRLDLMLSTKDDIFAVSALEGCRFTLESLEVCAGDNGMFVRLPVHTDISFCRRGTIRFHRPLESDRTQRRTA